MPTASRACLRAVVFMLGLGMAIHSPAAEGPASDTTIAKDAAGRYEGFWRQIVEDEPYETMGVRKLFANAMTLCMARQHPERLERLLQLAVRMQDRDPVSPGYGNLRWTWRDTAVTDRNAVEFCMQDAVVIWADHRDKIPTAARDVLRELMEFGVQGCLRHRVPTSYSNIAILNAGNLITLGELLEQPDAADEGYRRLEAICLWTWAFGTHEYCSPTYTAVDIEGLNFIHRYAGRPVGRHDAEALLEVLWSDVAANWFPAAGRLAGAHSRSYDYLRGLGSLGQLLRYQGWSENPNSSLGDMLRPSLGQWSPADRLRELSYKFPRTVRQSWGPGRGESRTHVMYPDVSLSAASAAYGSSDVPLTVDLPGPPHSVRCYFIADGREDPYGKKRYETSAARHKKALHLKPFWAAAQRGRDAVAVAIYRERDLPAEIVTNCQSHFVFRGGTDGLFVGGKPARIPRSTTGDAAGLAVAQNEPVVIRYGTAAVGVRVLWATTQLAEPAEVALIEDGNSSGALRLTVDHHDATGSVAAGLALWVRVGTALDTEQGFQRWRSDFELPDKLSEVQVTEQAVRVEVLTDEGPVSVAVTAPFGAGVDLQLVPEPARGTVEIDGKEVGRPILERLECIQQHLDRVRAAAVIDVPTNRGVYWEAESGLVFPGMQVGEDEAAFGGRFVWHPVDNNWDRATSTVTWMLNLTQAGRFYLWARVFAPDPKTDSFYLAVSPSTNDLVPRADWHTTSGPGWRWVPVALDRARTATVFDLPAGACRIQLSARESGAKVDRLFLTRSPSETP